MVVFLLRLFGLDFGRFALADDGVVGGEKSSEDGKKTDAIQRGWLPLRLRILDGYRAGVFARGVIDVVELFGISGVFRGRRRPGATKKAGRCSD